jgi:hypothetical protein
VNSEFGGDDFGEFLIQTIVCSNPSCRMSATSKCPLRRHNCFLRPWPLRRTVIDRSIPSLHSGGFLFCDFRIQSSESARKAKLLSARLPTPPAVYGHP